MEVPMEVPMKSSVFVKKCQFRILLYRKMSMEVPMEVPIKDIYPYSNESSNGSSNEILSLCKKS
jgi:hypothetical protein